MVWHIGDKNRDPLMLELVGDVDSTDDAALIGRSARMYRFGRCVGRNIERAVILYEAAAAIDDAWSGELTKARNEADREQNGKVQTSANE